MYSKLTVTILVAIFCSMATAGDFSQSSSRTGQWEFGLLFNQTDSWDSSGRSGSSIDVDDDTGWGFSIGYNYSEYFNLAFEFALNEPSYEATIVPDNPPEPAQTIRHKLTNASYTFNFSYNFLAKALTPYVVGGLGWNYLDSNISDGGIYAGCWWDPWWGYICTEYYSTYSDTAFSYSVGGGLRWEATSNFVMKVSINQRWIDLDSVGDTPEMKFGKVDLIWTM